MTNKSRFWVLGFRFSEEAGNNRNREEKPDK